MATRIPTFTKSTPDPMPPEEEEVTPGAAPPAPTAPVSGGRAPTPSFTPSSPTAAAPEAELGPSSTDLTNAALGNTTPAAPTAPVGRAAIPTVGTNPPAGMPIQGAPGQPYSGGGAPLPEFLGRTIGALPAPNKIVSRNWMRLDPSSQGFFRSAYEAQGYDPAYIDWMVQQGLPGRAATRMGQRGRILS